MKINHLQAKLEIKETELNEAKEKYRILSNDYDKIQEQNAKMLRTITNERFERFEVNSGGHTLVYGTREIEINILVASYCQRHVMLARFMRVFSTDYINRQNRN